MKKIFLLGFICMFALFSTGCTKTSCEIEINENNKVTITNDQGVKLQNKMLPKGFYEILEKDMNKLVKKYSTKENVLKPYINEYSAGVITKKDNLSFDEATKFLPAGYSAKDNVAFTKEKGLFKTTYKINLVYNPIVASKYVPEYYEEFKNSSETATKFGNKIISFASENVLVDNSNSKFLTIKIPRKAKKQNATTVISNREYQWDFSEANKDVAVNIEYTKFNFLPW